MPSDGLTESMPWIVVLTCTYEAATWADADAFRESYTSGPSVDPHGYGGDSGGHQRSARITHERGDF